MARVLWWRVPLLAAILPLGFLLAELYRGNPLSLFDFFFVWLFGMAILTLHVLVVLIRALKKARAP